MELVTPDKVRFCDGGAFHDPAPVHTLELSDQRSVRHFITLWFKSTHSGEAWATAAGNSREHSPGTYHREDEHTGAFVARRWPGKESQDWRCHYHVDLDHPPTADDVQQLAGVLPAGLLNAALEYLAKSVVTEPEVAPAQPIETLDDLEPPADLNVE